MWYFKNADSFCVSCFSASASVRSGREASNSTSSFPFSWPSSQAVHFSSNVFINISQQILEPFSRVEQPRHYRSNRTSQHFGDFIVLHVFRFFHENYCSMLRGKLGHGCINSRPDFLLLHSFGWSRICFRCSSGPRLDRL